MRKMILLIEVPRYTEGAIPLLVCHHVHTALYASTLCGRGNLAIKHHRKGESKEKHFCCIQLH